MVSERNLFEVLPIWVVGNNQTAETEPDFLCFLTNRFSQSTGFAFTFFTSGFVASRMLRHQSQMSCRIGLLLVLLHILALRPW